MILDTELEKRTDWQKKIGADIGGVSPDSYGWDQQPDSMRFYVRGSKPYSDWLAALHRPYLPNTGHLTLSYDLMTDAMAPAFGQATEFDTRVTDPLGNDNNFSLQNNYARGGMLQVSGQVTSTVVSGKIVLSGGDWVDTGIQYGIFMPRMWYSIRLHYAFDVVGLTYRTERIDINDERFYLNLPALKAVKSGWSAGAHLQVQQDTNASVPGGFDMYIRGYKGSPQGVCYEWA